MREATNDGPALLPAIAQSTARLLATAATLDDADVAAPSTLPGWNRAMVLTHLARNADGLRGMLEGAQRGEVAAMYPSGHAGRDADIEAGRARSAASVLQDLRASATHLEDSSSRLTPQQWTGTGRTLSGVLPVTGIPNLRLRELEIHHVDLDLAYLPGDWPAEWTAAELHGAVEDLPERLAGQGLRLVASDTGWTWESDVARDSEVAEPGVGGDADAATALVGAAAEATSFGAAVEAASEGVGAAAGRPGAVSVVRAPAAQLLAWLLGRPSTVTAAPTLGAW